MTRNTFNSKPHSENRKTGNADVGTAKKIHNIATTDPNTVNEVTGDYAVYIPVLLTIKELAKCAKKTGITEHRIRELVRSGELPAFKAGNKYLIDVMVFVAYITNASSAPDSELEASADGANDNRGGRNKQSR